MVILILKKSARFVWKKLLDVKLKPRTYTSVASKLEILLIASGAHSISVIYFV